VIVARYVGGVEYDEVMYAPGGIVHRWVHEVSSTMYFNLEHEVPFNKRPNKTYGQPPPGTMRALLFSDVDRVGPKEFVIDAGSNAHYTRYVVQGVPGRIYARSGRIPAGEPGGGQFIEIGEDYQSGMYLPANPGYGPGRRHQSVRGQSANNFIGRAYDTTARMHPALPGMAIGR
jgi:hypothetical protein